MPAEPAIVLFSGVDRADLVAQIDRMYTRLADGFEVSEPDSLQGAERLALVADRSDLKSRLAQARTRVADFKGTRLVIRQQGLFFASGASPGRIAFLFPGQGSQYSGMLRGVTKRLASVRSWFAALDRAFARAGELPPSRLIEADGAVKENRLQLMNMEQGAQLGTVADLALFEVLSRLGIRADVMLGHSNGEHAAIIAAGAATASSRDELCDGFCRVGLIGRRAGLPPFEEGLIAVANLSRDHLNRLLAKRPGQVFLAMDNCPHQQVLGGYRASLTALAAEARGLGAICSDIPLSRAHHTPLFDDWSITLGEYYRTLQFTPPDTQIYSCATAGPFPDDPAACRQLMVRQWTSTVQFRATIEALYDRGVRTFVEVGPDAKLTAFVEDTLRGRPHLAASVSSRLRDDLEQLLQLLALLFTQGLTIDPRVIQRVLSDDDNTLEVTGLEVIRMDSPGVQLPGVVATESEPQNGGSRPDPAAISVAVEEHRRLIADTRTSVERMVAVVRQRTEIADQPGQRSPIGDPSPWLGAAVRVSNGHLSAEHRFTRLTSPFVVDHALGRPGDDRGAGYPLPVLPFTVGLRLVEEAGRRLGGGRPVAEITDIRASRWMALDGGTLDLSIEAKRRGASVTVRLAERAEGTSFEATAHFAGAFLAAVAEPSEDLEAVSPSRWTAETFYRDFAFHGPSFQGMSRVLTVGPLGITAELAVTSLPGMTRGSSWLDPALLDCAGQLVAFWLLEHKSFDPQFGVFPFAARRVVLRGQPPEPNTRIRCRGQVVLRGSMTEASFAFHDLDGRILATIEGLAQRIIHFPPALASSILGNGSAEFSETLEMTPSRVIRRATIAEWEILGSSWGIWGRGLAHRVLQAHELTEWLALPTTNGIRNGWLLKRIVEREAVRLWEGTRPPGAARHHHVRVSEREGVIVAVVTGDDSTGPDDEYNGRPQSQGKGGSATPQRLASQSEEVDLVNRNAFGIPGL